MDNCMAKLRKKYGWFQEQLSKKTGSNSIDGHFDRKGHFNC